MNAKEQCEAKAKALLETCKFTVLWSGGKDSTATLLWVLNNIKHSDWNILYVEVTGNTHPLCNQYVHDVAEQLGVSNKLIHAKTPDFYELAMKWGIPLLFAYRWCMTLKVKLFNKHSHKVCVDGIRHDPRSQARRKMTHFYVKFKMTNRLAVSPILWWSAKEAYNYILKNGIPLNPCYRIYGHSGNCMLCPYANRKHIILTMSDPYWREKITQVIQNDIEMAKRKGKKLGSIKQSVINKWLKFSLQTTLPTL